MGEKIPSDVKVILAQFDLSSFEFGELVFGISGRAIYIQTLNLEDYVHMNGGETAGDTLNIRFTLAKLPRNTGRYDSLP